MLRRATLILLLLVTVPTLAASDAPGRATIETLPAARGGQDIVGKALPRLVFDEWLSPSTLDIRRPVKGRPTLYRWSTDSCPYCKASLSAFEMLRKKYPGLDVVAVYHPKPPRDVRPREVTEAAAALGYEGLIAVDKYWSELHRAYLDKGVRQATSVTILVDKTGIVRFVHPGPVLFPSDDPQYAQENADFVLLEKAVQALLAAP